MGAELPANVSKNRYPHVLPCKCSVLPPAPPPVLQCPKVGSWGSLAPLLGEAVSYTSAVSHI